MHSIALFNLKGGVGKTSTAVNLAYAAAAEGCRVLLWDLDAQGGASYILRQAPARQGFGKATIKGRTPLAALLKPTLFDRLDLIPASRANRKLDVLLAAQDVKRGMLTRLIRPLADAYDVLVLDCPPSLSLLAQQILVAADLVILPVIPAPLSANAVTMVRAELESIRVPERKLRVVFNMVDRRRTLHRQWVVRPPEALRERFATVVPASAVVERMSVERLPLAAFAWGTPAAIATRELWIEALEWLEGGHGRQETAL